MKVLTSKYEYLGYDKALKMHKFHEIGSDGLVFYPECKWVKAKTTVYMCSADGRMEPTYATQRRQRIQTERIDAIRTYQ